MKNKSIKHWIVLAIATSMFAASGGIINNVIGVFYQPMAQDLNILVGDVAFHATITSVVIGLTALFIPKMIHKIGWRLLIIIGSLLAFFSTVGMAFFDSLTMFYILGAIRGFGASTFQLVAISMILNNWFEEKNGLAMSIASAFSGFVGMIAAPIISNVVGYFGWRTGFITAGFTILIFLLPAMIYPLTVTPEASGLLPYGQKKEDNAAGFTEKEVSVSGKDKHVISKIAFTAIFFFALLNTVILGMNQHLSSYGESIGMSITFSGYMLSAVMLGNIFFKIIIGPISDKIGTVKSTIFLNFVNISGLLLLIVGHGRVIPIVAAFLFGSVFSIGSVLLPLLTNDIFGRAQFGQVFPVLTFISNIGVALSNTLVGYIYDFTGTYTLAFTMGIIFQIFNLFSLYVANKYAVKPIDE